ncbi:sigma factor [Catalinimonas sp. 4WD22]|uniref:RNA polymerase sigma factor n=1 Tax=Catalinimonas locisalis TaxID=3133978 RepID=UPI003101967A
MKSLQKYGQRGCFLLVRCLRPPLYAMIVRMLGDEAKAEELLMLTFARSMEKIDSFDVGKRSLYTYYKGNIALDGLKSSLLA